MPEEGEKKIKKKKSKKSDKAAEEVEAPPPEPEPEPEAPPPEETPAEQAPPEVTETPVQDVEAIPEGEELLPLDDEVDMAPPPQKKKPKYFVHWDRRKAKFYDYNFAFGESYYSGLVNYLTSRKTERLEELPRRKNWAERSLHASIERKSCPDMATQYLLRDVRSSIRGFEDFQRVYATDNRKY